MTFTCVFSFDEKLCLKLLNAWWHFTFQSRFYLKIIIDIHFLTFKQIFNSQALISLLAQMEISCTVETLCCVLLADIKNKGKKRTGKFSCKDILANMKNERSVTSI